MEEHRDLEPATRNAEMNNQESTEEREVQWRVTLQELHRAAMEGNWEAAKQIFDKYPNAKTAKLNGEGMTALHVAAKCGRSEFVENLVSILHPEELEMKDQVGRNALHYVALASNVRAAKAILRKNPNLALVEEVFRSTPLFYAARWRHPSKSKEMLEYLYKQTGVQAYTSGETAPSLIVAITASGCHGIALKFLEGSSALAFKGNLGGWSILHSLASQPSAFASGSNCSMWERFIDYWMNIATAKHQVHKDALELVHFVCKELRKERESAVMEYFFPRNSAAILHFATENGAFELVQVCLAYFPNLIWYTSSDGKLLLHVAVEHRRMKIFNHVMHLIGENAGVYAGTRVEGNNNILHLAAKLAPTPQLHSVPGPAFQVQRELQWFKAVESIVYTEERLAKNYKNETPVELFFKEHDKLITDAKEWMKDTSNSCMIVAALVATVAFASMITVPGGNDNGTGMPVLSKKNLFVIFSVANASSMISSAVALLMFLSLQTSRFTDEDFLDKLPKNLLRGLLSMFVAVATMMIAFGTAIGLALQTRIKWGYIPITVVACIPAIIFTRLQLPLLFQTLVVTSGPLIYGQRRNRKMWCLKKLGYNLVPSDLG